jgi:phosphate-selective porin OprO and OprP
VNPGARFVKKHYIFAAMLSSSALLCAQPAFAQTADKEAEPPADAPSPDDASQLTIPNDQVNASTADSKDALLQAQIESLQAQLDELKKGLAKATPSWKGAPQFADADDGWTFKVRGRLMVDAGYIAEPKGYTANRNLGFNARVRRFRIGVEGTIPGDFAYKAEVDYANAAVGFGDVILTYQPKDRPWSVSIGNHESFESLEQMTSSRWVSFIERAQMNDAFGHTRRLGLSLGYASKDGLFRANGGLFAAHSIDASIDNDGWIGAARVTYTPYVGSGFVHLGLNYEHRRFQSNDATAAGVSTASVSVGAPSTNQLGRYRARPFLQTTDVRFVDTGAYAAKSDDIFGVEAFGVFKSLHLGGEFQYVKVNGYRPGTQLLNLRDYFAGSNTAVYTPNGNPNMKSGFFEVGYFLTGETRGYKNGMWDRTKVLHPFNKGGSGAVEINARFDYLNLNSNALRTGGNNNFTTGAFVNTPITTPTDARLSRGGIQTGYLLGLTWIPTDYVRFLVNYIHTEVQGGPLAQTLPRFATSLTPIDKRTYSTDGVAVRAQIDF